MMTQRDRTLYELQATDPNVLWLDRSRAIKLGLILLSRGIRHPYIRLKGVRRSSV